MHEFVALDLGSKVIAWTGRDGDRTVCVTTPRALSNASLRRVVRELMRRQGRDCTVCRSCPIGQLE
ncbi:hypothetical protein CTZ28_44380 [Streptomyces shenzhenensis]|uniref:Uncharacterized protein n=1 Tax=Streptomyces shenzhenensis TaxID=943815 RepID=A0A3M0HYU8_9ACTN|nr:hypothetical protein CTZ28_44380 [Streptomyces shenzhenensis]